MRSHGELISMYYKHLLIDPNKYIDVHVLTGHPMSLGGMFLQSSVLDILSDKPDV